MTSTLSLVALVLCTLTVSARELGAQHPVVPGVHRLRLGSSPDSSTTSAVRGHVLLRELDCTACHSRSEPRTDRAPDLSRIGARVTKSWLRRFLQDPQKTKPGTTMPNVLHSLSATDRDRQVDELLHYLASRGGPLRPAKIPVSEVTAEHGRELYHSIGCVACHASESGPGLPTDVPLGDLARKTSIDELIEFLHNPKSTRPSSRMPDLRLTANERKALAMYLLREQMTNPQSAGVAKVRRPGLLYDYYEIDLSRLPDFSTLDPTAKGHVESLTIDVPARMQRKRQERFAIRYRGELKVPKTGSYSFYLTSDDGSQLALDDEIVVRNDSVHAMHEESATLDLAQGAHSFELQFFEKAGGEGLQLHWSGPGIDKISIPASAYQTGGERPMIPLDSESFAIDSAKALRGKDLYSSLGCATCHEPAAIDRSGGNSSRQAASLRSMTNSRAGCLSDKPSPRSVDYQLSTNQRDDLRTAIDAKTGIQALTTKDRILAQLATNNCYACHQRDGIGGIEEARDRFFGTKISIDLGDEGRLPPPLNEVGDKLRHDAIIEVLTGTELHVRRRFMKARMPSFEQDLAKSLADDFTAVDRRIDDVKPPKFDKAVIEAGRRIVGTNGFACVTCHNVNGNRSPAIPGIDLANATRRLRPSWFRRFVKNPMAMRRGTRMPGFWPGDLSPFTGILDGSSNRQIEAVWSYLSLGKSMPAPKGVVPPEGRPAMELTPLEEPIIHRTFMKDVGPRTILCGYPESVHVAFDAHRVRLAKVWRGRFFDASGVTTGRTDKFLGPLGEDILDLPSPAFAFLRSSESDWPKLPRLARNVGGDFLGYKLDPQGRPTFRYRLRNTTIEDKPIPELAEGGTVLRRQLRLNSTTKPTNLYFLVWRGTKIKELAKGIWQSGTVTIELIGNRNPAVLRQHADQTELRLPITSPDASFEEIIRW